MNIIKQEGDLWNIAKEIWPKGTYIQFRNFMLLYNDKNCKDHAMHFCIYSVFENNRFVEMFLSEKEAVLFVEDRKDTLFLRKIDGVCYCPNVKIPKCFFKTIT